MSQTYPGRCLCGAVEMQGRGAVELGVCHCSMCRRWTGGPFFGVQFADGLEITKGDALRWYQSSPWAERGFCGSCGATLFYRFKVGAGELHATAGPFDLPAGAAIAQHIFVEEKPAYYEFADEAPRRTGAELMAEYQAKMSQR